VLPKRMTVVTVTVDPLRCGCTGYCVRLAPAVFRLPESGPAEVVTAHPDAGLADSAREAAAVCPTNAILLVLDRED
jgi:ferredoxin